MVGIFGEREFITALFPGYVGSLRHAASVPKSIDALLVPVTDQAGVVGLITRSDFFTAFGGALPRPWVTARGAGS